MNEMCRQLLQQIEKREITLVDLDIMWASIQLEPQSFTEAEVDAVLDAKAIAPGIVERGAKGQ